MQDIQIEITKMPQYVKKELATINAYLNGAKMILEEQLKIQFNPELMRVEARLDEGLDKLEAVIKMLDTQ